MNLLYRNIRISLGNINLKNTRQSCTISIMDVRNSFIRTRFTVKSKERITALFNGHTSRAYSRTGMTKMFIFVQCDYRSPYLKAFQKSSPLLYTLSPQSTGQLDFESNLKASQGLMLSTSQSDSPQIALFNGRENIECYILESEFSQNIGNANATHAALFTIHRVRKKRPP